MNSSSQYRSKQALGWRSWSVFVFFAYSLLSAWPNAVYGVPPTDDRVEPQFRYYIGYPWIKGDFGPFKTLDACYAKAQSEYIKQNEGDPCFQTWNSLGYGDSPEVHYRNGWHTHPYLSITTACDGSRIVGGPCSLDQSCPSGYSWMEMTPHFVPSGWDEWWHCVKPGRRPPLCSEGCQSPFVDGIGNPISVGAAVKSETTNDFAFSTVSIPLERTYRSDTGT